MTLQHIGIGLILTLGMIFLCTLTLAGVPGKEAVNGSLRKRPLENNRRIETSILQDQRLSDRYSYTFQ